MLLLSLLALSSPLAHAAEQNSALFEHLTVSKTYKRVQITHYSATPDNGRVCRYEQGIGGRDESPSGFRPLSHRLGKPGPIYGRPTILTAVPQEGGTNGAYRCFFALPDAYPGKLFFGGDVYGPDSNGLFKTDISSPCTSVVNVTKYSRMIVYDCGSRAARVGPLYNPNRVIAKPTPPRKPIPVPEPGEEPVPQPPEPVSECQWYAVATCDRTEESLERDLSELGNDFKILQTDSVPSFSRGWYCIVSGSNDRDSAVAKVRTLRKKNSSAYVKKGC